MKIVDAIAEILKREGTEFLSAYPTTSIIDAAAAAGIRPVLCRQERVGVGIADGYARTLNGRRPAVFAMQYGPGAENAFPGVATAYSDSTPVLVLPLGHQRDRAQVFPLFSSARTYASVTKWVETLNQPDQVVEVMRRASSPVVCPDRFPDPLPCVLPNPMSCAPLSLFGRLIPTLFPALSPLPPSPKPRTARPVCRRSRTGPARRHGRARPATPLACPGVRARCLCRLRL